MKLWQRLAVVPAAAIAIGIAMLPAAPAKAASGTFNISVTANTQDTCNGISSNTPTLAFGQYLYTGSLATTASATFTCFGGVAMTIGLSNGDVSSCNTSTTGRQMNGTTLSSNHLLYNVYEDSSHTTAWPCSSGAVSQTYTNGSPFTVTFYGLVPANQNSVPVDTYTDTLLATVNY